MRQVCAALLLFSIGSLYAAENADEEIAAIRMLWSVAEQGKASTVKEADIVSLMTKTWQGRRLAPWCYHALVKIGVPPEKHYETFLSVSRHWQKQPEGMSDAVYAKGKAGPPLPDDLKPAFTTVWTTAMDIICNKFANADEQTVDNYRGSIRELDAPKEITVPRVCAILVDPKRTTSQRNVSTMVLRSIGPNEAAIDPLIKAIKDPIAKVRGNAVNALRDQGTRGPKVTVTFKDTEKIRNCITELLKTETDKSVRTAAESFLKVLQ